MASGLVFIAFSRHLRRHPWQLVLAALGITVGVAVVVAIRLTQFSAIDAFDTATRATAGTATHRITASRSWLDHADYRHLAARHPGLPMTPVLTTSVTLPERDGERVLVLGIDPVSRQAMAPPGQADPVYFDTARLITLNAAVINETSARRLRVAPGDTLTVATTGRRHGLELIAQVPPAAVRGGLVDDVLLVDIATAQEITERYDAVSYIDLKLRDERDIVALRRTLARTGAGADLHLVDLAAESRRTKRMTEAFYANLTALSLMALLVGMFLIYNTETFLVVQRRSLLGRLRALGVSRTELLCAVLGEAVLIGLLGSVAGLALGIVTANGLLALVTTTVSDLYFSSATQRVVLSPLTLAGGFAAGVLATLLAALVPAVHAARIEPNIVITRTGVTRRGTRRVIGGAVLLASVLLAAAATVLWIGTSLLAGFVAIALMVIAFAVLCPLAMLGCASVVAAVVRHRAIPEYLACRSVRTALNRTAPATAALMVATAASIGIGVMVTSFRVAVTDWLESALRADLYIVDSTFDQHAHRDKITPQVVAQLRQLPGVADVSTVSRREVRTPYGPATVSAFDLTPAARRGFRLRAGDATRIWQRWNEDDVVIVTEPYAYHHDIRPGDMLTLTTEAGERDFEVLGIYLDYASERGSVSMSRARYRRYWSSDGFDGVGVYAEAGGDNAALRRAVDRVLDAYPGLIANSAAELQRSSLRVFDRTFLITDVLRLIAVSVSFIGVFGALLAQQIERTREYGTLRALGLGASGMLRVVLTQTLLVGVTAAAVAVPVGVLVGYVLIEVINPRSFGWTMDLVIMPGLIRDACAVALLAAVAAGLYPGLRVTRIEPAAALRYE